MTKKNEKTEAGGAVYIVKSAVTIVDSVVIQPNSNKKHFRISISPSFFEPRNAAHIERSANIRRRHCHRTTRASQNVDRQRSQQRHGGISMK